MMYLDLGKLESQKVQRAQRLGREECVKSWPGLHEMKRGLRAILLVMMA